jgi:peptide/nickel transport system substrate-binding protein
VKLSFTLSTTAGDHLREQTQQFMQQSFRKVGIDMRIENHPPAVMWGEIFFKSKYDAVIVGVPYLVGGDPDTTESHSSKAIPIKGGSGSNTSQYSNPKVDKLLEEGASTFSVEKRKQIYNEVQQLLREDLAFLPLFQQAFIFGSDARLKGITPNPNVLVNTWNIGSWKFA